MLTEPSCCALAATSPFLATMEPLRRSARRARIQKAEPTAAAASETAAGGREQTGNDAKAGLGRVFYVCTMLVPESGGMCAKLKWISHTSSTTSVDLVRMEFAQWVADRIAECEMTVARPVEWLDRGGRMFSSHGRVCDMSYDDYKIETLMRIGKPLVTDHTGFAPPTIPANASALEKCMYLEPGADAFRCITAEDVWCQVQLFTQFGLARRMLSNLTRDRPPAQP
jgi:hypothetical protein